MNNTQESHRDWSTLAKEAAIQAHRRKVRVALSPTCNMFCHFCDHERGRSHHKPGSMEDFRASTIEEGGRIDTETCIKLIQGTFDIGFRGVTFTGGEPMMNQDWDKIVVASAQMGMEQICLTTNGLYLSKYMKQHHRLPEGLNLLTVSFDTFNEEDFLRITKVAGLPVIVKGLEMVREAHPELATRANRVVTRSSMPGLLEFIKRCEASALFKELNLLNLILKSPLDPHERSFFAQEFVYPDEIIRYLTAQGYQFSDGEKFEPTAVTENGIKIIVKDTDRTLRHPATCTNCPMYCQEGFYTIRIATDGVLRPCGDYTNALPYIDGVQTLKDGGLKTELEKLAVILYEAELQHTLRDFITRYAIELQLPDDAA